MKRHINRRRFLGLSAGAAVAATVGGATSFTPFTSSLALAATGLVGYWKFDEGSGASASDASGNGYTATLQSGASWGTGQIGAYSLSLTGSSTSYADIPETVVNTTQSFSVAAWVKLNATSGYQTFVSLDGNQVSAFYLQLRGDTGTFAFTRLASDAVSAVATFASAGFTPTTGVWYHLVGVYNASAQNLALYVNGTIQQTTTYTNAWQGTGHTEIGRGKFSGNPVDFVHGQIDDVHIYNLVLSAKGAADLAAVDYWTFDEGSGTAAADASGNGRTATLQGGASWATGKVGPYALGLNGSNTSYADVAATAVNTTQSFSVAAWIKLNSTSGYQTFVSLDGNQVSAFYLQLRGDTGTFAFTRLASDAVSAAVTHAAASSGPAAGTWYHLAGVYDASAQTLALYVNGSLQQTISYTSAWQGSGHTEIGRGKYGGNPVDFVHGQIDDVHIYNIALDITAVNTLAGITLVPTLAIQANQAGATISPTLYGLMFEDISHSGDGGLYGELIRNHIFKDNANAPDSWSLVKSSGASGSIALDSTNQVNTVALTTSLKLTINSVGAGQRVGLANTGFWGIPVRPHTTYHASFYAQAAPGFRGPLTVDIESNDGSTVYASATVNAISMSWQKYSVTLTTGNVTTSATNRFVISASQAGTVWFNLVSLFPPTWNSRPNGMRPDLMQWLSSMRPAFLRFPGGNFLEGETSSDYFAWKNTIGDLSLRPGHNDPWGYRSSDGLGLLEYLEWCEDLNMSPVLAVYAGYSLNGTHLTPGTAAFHQIVQDALDEIEYATGSLSTTWGARRAADGHPAPFKIEYVEIGNEDQFDSSGSYDARFTAFYDPIKAAYPSIKLIATTTVTSRTPDVYDQHFYPSPATMESYATHYDNYSRSGPKIFVGEYASQEGTPTPDLNAALGDAAFMTGLERNSDLVVLASYAPLLVNVHELNWNTNLLGFDGLNSYASPSYYVQKLFSLYHGNVVLPAQLTGGSGGLYYVTSKVTSNNTVYIKMVNTNSTPQKVQIVLKGASSVRPQGTTIVLTSASPSDTNTLSLPTKVVPVAGSVNGLSSSFSYTFAPYSVTVLVLIVT